jgi:hypothetical protein
MMYTACCPLQRRSLPAVRYHVQESTAITLKMATRDTRFRERCSKQRIHAGHRSELVGTVALRGFARSLLGKMDSLGSHRLHQPTAVHLPMGSWDIHGLQRECSDDYAA